MARFRRFCGVLRKRGRLPDEAEDLVQEAYVRLLSYIDRGARVLEPDAFVARTVLNLHVDHSRRERTRVLDTRALEELLLIDDRPGPEETLASEQYVQRICQLLDAAAGQKTRAAFLMHSLEGMTYEEIGAQLGMSGRSIERHIAKAIAVLTLDQQPRP